MTVCSPNKVNSNQARKGLAPQAGCGLSLSKLPKRLLINSQVLWALKVGTPKIVVMVEK